MRIYRVSPLFLLLAPCLVHGQSSRRPRVPPADGADVLTNDEILPLNIDVEHQQQQQRRETPLNNALGTTTRAAVALDPTLPARSTQTTSTRGYKGTEDAPVDGLDGKPHAGPFVDTTPETTKSASTQTQKKLYSYSFQRHVFTRIWFPGRRRCSAATSKHRALEHQGHRQQF